MSETEEERLLDLISEASLAPQLWTPVMAKLVELLGGRGAMLSRMSIHDASGSAQFVRPDVDEAERLFAVYGAKNPMQIVADSAAYRRSWVPRVLTDDELMPKTDLMRSEFYNDCLRPLDIHSVMFFRLALHDDDVYAISVSRAARRDRFDGDDLGTARRLHPHLLRSFALGRKFATEQRASDNLADVLNGLRQAVVLVDAEGRVRHLNAAAERQIGRSDGLLIIGGRLTASNPIEARRLAQIVGVAGSPKADQRISGTMFVGLTGGCDRLSVTVSPLRSARDSIFGAEACVMVAIVDPRNGIGLDVGRLRDLFGLTAAEARVALAIFNGQSPKAAAADLGVSFFTIRGHLVRIYEKTGISRQADLVRVMLQACNSL